MKYVMVNSTPVLVNDKPNGEEIKNEALRHGVEPRVSRIGLWQLLGHNANGTSVVVGNTDITGHYNYDVILI